MVKGRLSKNKRKRENRNYKIEPKVKILSVDRITPERVNNMQNAGCIVVLKGIGHNKEDYIVHKVELKENLISAASSFSEGTYLKNFYFKASNIPHYINEENIPIDTSFWSYPGLEEKIKIAEEKGFLEKSLEVSK